MFQEKLKIAMNDVYEDMVRSASIENRLTGTMKPPEAVERMARSDEKVKLMSDPNSAIPTKEEKAAAAGSVKTKSAPVGAPVDDIKNLKIDK